MLQAFAALASLLLIVVALRLIVSNLRRELPAIRKAVRPLRRQQAEPLPVRYRATPGRAPSLVRIVPAPRERVAA